MAKINNWVFQWKINFNPNRRKQTQEVIFSRKLKKTIHPQYLFNNIQVSLSSSQKHLGIILDEQLTFWKHLNMLTSKIDKNHRTFTKITKPFTMISFNNHYIKLSSDLILIMVIYMTKPAMHLSTINLNYSIQCFPGYNWSYQRYLWRKFLPRIRFEAPSVSGLVQKTKPFLTRFIKITSPAVFPT